MTAEIYQYYHQDLIHLTNLDLAFNAKDDMIRVRYVIVDYNKKEGTASTGFEIVMPLKDMVDKQVIDLSIELLKQYIDREYNNATS